MTATSTIAYLRSCLQTPELQAFGRVVRTGESNADTDEAYRALYGWRPGNGRVFDDFTDHPRQAFKSSYGWTSAAGAYQAMCAVPGKVSTDTWGDFVKWCGRQGVTPTFSPPDQDLFFAWCVILRRKAMPALLARDLERAIELCNAEWASLPGSKYGQPLMSIDRAHREWTTWLAYFDAQRGPVAQPTPAPPQAPQATTPPPAPAAAPSAPPGQPQTPSQPQRQPTEDDLQSGRAFTQPEQPAMPIPILAVGAKALVSSLAGTLIEAFTPLAREKIQTEIGRHTDRPEIVEQITAGVMTAARAVTGLADPVQAAAEVARSPAALQQVEQSALDTLAQLAPVLEQLARLDQAQWQRDEDSRAAADARARANPVADQDEYLTQSIVRLMVGVLLGGAILTGVLAYLKVEVQVILGALLALVGAIGGKFSTRYDHRYGSSSGSAAKEAVNLALIQQQRK